MQKTHVCNQVGRPAKIISNAVFYFLLELYFSVSLGSRMEQNYDYPANIWLGAETGLLNL